MVLENGNDSVSLEPLLGAVVSHVENIQPAENGKSDTRRSIMSAVASAFILRECGLMHDIKEFSVGVSGVVVHDASLGGIRPCGNWSVSVSNLSSKNYQASMEEMNEALSSPVFGLGLKIPRVSSEIWERVENDSSALNFQMSDLEKGRLVSSAMATYITRASDNGADLSSLMREAAVAMVNCALLSGKREFLLLLDKSVSISVKKLSDSIIGPEMSIH